MPVVPPPSPDAVPTHAERERNERLAREAQALRDNLRRRKQQSRARQDAADTPQHPATRTPEATGDC